MNKIKVKNDRGITLTTLVIYISVLTLVIGVLTTISTYFYTNIGSVVDSPKYVNELNKFAMFFVVDIKNYNNATVSSNTIQFEGGPVYKYENNCIYRNDVEIAKDVMNCSFSLKNETVSSVSKNIINVAIQIGESESNSMTENIDFTLRYW